LSLASGLILVETLIDLARPWPLKLAVDNAIGGQPLGGVLAVLNQLGPGWRRWPWLRGSGWWGRGAGRIPDHLSDVGDGGAGGADLREAVFGRMLAGAAVP
jgi:hypothetical protein